MLSIFFVGLIVDKYRDTLVMQTSTMGMHNLKEFIVDVLKQTTKAERIYEKSNSPARREEGLPGECNGWLLGGCSASGIMHDGEGEGHHQTKQRPDDDEDDEEEEVQVHEHGIKYIVPIVHGQKTG